MPIPEELFSAQRSVGAPDLAIWRWILEWARDILDEIGESNDLIQEVIAVMASCTPDSIEKVQSVVRELDKIHPPGPECDVARLLGFFAPERCALFIVRHDQWPEIYSGRIASDYEIFLLDKEKHCLTFHSNGEEFFIELEDIFPYGVQNILLFLFEVWGGRRQGDSEKARQCLYNLIEVALRVKRKEEEE
ncbi:hypothetical protein HY629_02115 [Candidatus Uhrbacteria bacterium]|nr:hypothetical protein [Candidatus Uhrbacteria bacterium]